MTAKPLQIPIDKIKADFQSFLAPDHNRRVIFSGPFGIGKTYFLNEFFEEKKEEYFPVFLRPINYSLLSNEDVFKFIKYDILAQVIQNEYFEIGKNFDFSAADYAKFYAGQNGFSILFNLLKYAPKVGAFVKASEKLGILVDKFKEGLKEVNGNPELKMLKEFGEQAENHFLYENDGVTEFISEQLDKLVTPAEGEEIKQKKVLILDDLDRLDPEHIFRLFNVFSAHFDQVNYYENLVEGEIRNDNKFGFDKIIFVCDIENIRKIFAHKYGSEVDFSGYIDKFYSTEIFRFLHDDVFEGSIYPFIHEKLKELNPSSSDDYLVEEFRLILNILFSTNQINIREIIRLSSFNSSLLNKGKKYKDYIVPVSKIGAKEDTTIINYNFLIILKLMIDLFGNKEIVKKKLASASENLKLGKNINMNNYYPLFSDLVLFSHFEEHRFEIVKNPISDEKGNVSNELIFIIPETDIEIKYIIDGRYIDDRYQKGPMLFIAVLADSLPIMSIAQFTYLLYAATNQVFTKELLD